MTKLKNYIGFRSETLYGSGIRDIFKVTNHEINDLGNSDILTTLKTTKRKLKTLLKKLYAQGYTECIWLCDTPTILCACYGKTDDIGKYTIKNGIVLTDLGRQGKLIAYKPKELK